MGPGRGLRGGGEGEGEGEGREGAKGIPHPGGRVGGRQADAKELQVLYLARRKAERTEEGGRAGGRGKDDGGKKCIPLLYSRLKKLLRRTLTTLLTGGQMVGLALAHIGRTWKGEIVAPNADDVPLHDDCEEFGRMIVNKHLALF